MSVSFSDIVKYKLNGDFKKVNEASLNRLYQHYKDSTKIGFAILTSWKEYDVEGVRVPEQENIELFSKLKNTIRSMQLGFVRLTGYWKDEKSKEQVIEPSLFVIGIDLKKAKKLGKKYNQEAILYSGPETSGDIYTVYMNGVMKNVGKFHPQKIANAYSMIKGKPFVFEYIEYTAQCWMHAVIEQMMKREREKV